MKESTYTAFVNGTDPGVDDKYLHEGWLEKALNQVRLVEEPGDITQYFRYAPHEDEDELPTTSYIGFFYWDAFYTSGTLSIRASLSCRGAGQRTPFRVSHQARCLRTSRPERSSTITSSLHPEVEALALPRGLVEAVCRLSHSGDPRPLRTLVKSLRRKLGDDAKSPTYVFTEPGVGYLMPKGEKQAQEPPATL